MNTPNLNSYIICSTPRTGSTFLCYLLQSTNVAGNPQSYFRRQDLIKYADEWGILSKPQNSFDFSEYLKAAIHSGCSKNRVFSVRIMWGSMDELIDNLRPIYPEKRGNDKDLLEQAFGKTKFIYLRRQDVVAQAVSRLRAEQTDIWHVDSKETSPTPQNPPQYNFDLINHYVYEASEHNDSWQSWFKSNDIRPHEIIYENLKDYPAEEISKILVFLAIKHDSKYQIKVTNKQMSDSLSTTWIQKYKDEA